MISAIRIEPFRGALSIEGRPQILFGGSPLASVKSALRRFISSEREWARAKYQSIECHQRPGGNQLAFGGWPCEFVVTFQSSQLTSLMWRISRGWPYDADGWPSEE